MTEGDGFSGSEQPAYRINATSIRLHLTAALAAVPTVDQAPRAGARVALGAERPRRHESRWSASLGRALEAGQSSETDQAFLS